MTPRGWLTFDGMTWPDPSDPLELEYRLRHAPTTLSRSEHQAIAAMVHAYKHLVALDSRTRQKRVMRIRKYFQENTP